jgi:hypothetical protein
MSLPPQIIVILMIVVRIKENSLLAKIAAQYMKSDKMAIVMGKKICLHNTSKQEFLNSPKWLRHEVAHVKQYQQLGKFKFICSYLLETFNMGYEFNKYEVEARQKEKDESILKGVELI